MVITTDFCGGSLRVVGSAIMFVVDNYGTPLGCYNSCPVYNLVIGVIRSIL